MPIVPVAGAKEIWVRIRPFNPQRKRFRKRHATWFGITIYEERGWCRVPEKITHGGKTIDVGEYMRGVRQFDQDPDSELVFDVCTKEEAQALERREKKALEEKNTADNAAKIGGVENPVNMLRIEPTVAGDDDEDVNLTAPTPAKPKRGRPARAAVSA